VGHPAGSKIYFQEKDNRKHRRELMMGVKCAKGTIPRVYRHAEPVVGPVITPAKKKAWYIRLGALIKASCKSIFKRKDIGK
jgi:hypothetical protein